MQPVRELYGLMAAQRVAGGFVVTSGTFTEEARKFVEGRELKLIDGQALQRGIRAQAAASPAESRPAAASPEPRGRVEPVMTAGTARTAPLCPVCQAPMVQRQARNGPNAGTRFWGCSRYGETKCRGTRAIV